MTQRVSYTQPTIESLETLYLDLGMRTPIEELEEVLTKFPDDSFERDKVNSLIKLIKGRDLILDFFKVFTEKVWNEKIDCLTQYIQLYKSYYEDHLTASCLEYYTPYFQKNTEKFNKIILMAQQILSLKKEWDEQSSNGLSLYPLRAGFHASELFRAEHCSEYVKKQDKEAFLLLKIGACFHAALYRSFYQKIEEVHKAIFNQLLDIPASYDLTLISRFLTHMSYAIINDSQSYEVVSFLFLLNQTKIGHQIAGNTMTFFLLDHPPKKVSFILQKYDLIQLPLSN